jgi:integrase
MLSKILDVASKEFSITLLRGNPVAAVRKPGDSSSRERRLDFAGWEALQAQLKQSRNPWLWPASQLAVETAMRQGELLALRWEHIDLDKRTTYLPKTKNGESRVVPLSSTAKAVLAELLRSIDGRALPTNKQTLYSAFAAACQRAAIYDFTFHDLRHEALSRLAERGDLSVLELSAISGHKTLRLVQQYVQLHASKLAEKLG